MRRIPVCKIEEIIYFYDRVRDRLYSHGDVKINYSVQLKARELGFSLRSARVYIELAKKVGMIEESVE